LLWKGCFNDTEKKSQNPNEKVLGCFIIIEIKESDKLLKNERRLTKKFWQFSLSPVIEKNCVNSKQIGDFFLNG